MRSFALWAAAAVCVLCSIAAGAEDRREDEQAIRKSTASFVAAVNRRDAEAAAALLTADADMVTASGDVIKGRDAIRAELEQFFGELGPSKTKLETISIRFLSPRVAVEDGASKALPTPPGPPTHSHHTIVHVKRKGGWRIAGIRTSLSFPESNYAQLAELEWVVGRWQWQGEGPDDQRTESTFRWSENKNFILHDFSGKRNNQMVASGTERIGWDPRTGAVKSWVFTSDGGVIEGTWTPDGEGWRVAMAGALGNGTAVSGTLVITPLDGRTFRFEVVDRVRDGQSELDMPPVEMKRVGRR